MPQTSHVTASRGPKISSATSVGKAALLLGMMVALSRLTGFGRMMVLSRFYGISPLTDAYNAAFNIPDTLSILIAGGALATGFVPVFTGLLERGQGDAAVRTFRAMWTLLLVAFGVLTLVLLGLSFTPIALSLAPAKVTPEIAALYLKLLRILLVSTFFYVLGGLFAGTLNAMRHFWFFALQPVAFNLGIIAFGIIGPKYLGAGIESQAWGALFGSVFGSIVIQVPGIYRHGLTLKPLWDTRDAGVRQVLRGLLPIAFGLASGQIIALNLPRFFATGAIPGDLSALDYANRLVTVPLAVLASGPAIALFPTLVQMRVNGRTGALRDQLAASLRGALTLNLLAASLLVPLARPLIGMLLQHGSFTAENTRATALVLICYTPGLIALSAQQFLSRGFYALDDTRTPTLIGASSMAFFFVTAWASLKFGRSEGSSIAPALALCSSLSIAVLSAWMGRSLASKLGGWDGSRTLQVLGRGGVAAVASSMAAWAVTSAIPWAPLAFVGGAFAGTALFVGVGAELELEEISAVTSKLSKVGGKLRRK